MWHIYLTRLWSFTKIIQLCSTLNISQFEKGRLKISLYMLSTIIITGMCYFRCVSLWLFNYFPSTSVRLIYIFRAISSYWQGPKTYMSEQYVHACDLEQSCHINIRSLWILTMHHIPSWCHTLDKQIQAGFCIFHSWWCQHMRKKVDKLSEYSEVGYPKKRLSMSNTILSFLFSFLAIQICWAPVLTGRRPILTGRRPVPAFRRN